MTTVSLTTTGSLATTVGSPGDDGFRLRDEWTTGVSLATTDSLDNWLLGLLLVSLATTVGSPDDDGFACRTTDKNANNDELVT